MRAAAAVHGGVLFGNLGIERGRRPGGVRVRQHGLERDGRDVRGAPSLQHSLEQAGAKVRHDEHLPRERGGGGVRLARQHAGQRADRLAEVGRGDRLHPDAEPQAHELHFPEFFRVDLIGE